MRALAVLAVVLVAADLGAGLAGLDEHVAVIAGMPASAASFVLGPARVALHLAAAVLAPIGLLAGAGALALRRAGQPR